MPGYRFAVQVKAALQGTETIASWFGLVVLSKKIVAGEAELQLSVGVAPFSLMLPDTATWGVWMTLSTSEVAPAAVHTPCVEQVNPAGHPCGHEAPQTFGVPPPPHESGEVQVPQLSALPQPSSTAPQFFPSSAHVFGVHAPFPHTLGVPAPPQVSPEAVQLPHSSCPPHSSLTVPQFLPSCAHVFGVQAGTPQTLGVPPPPQVSPIFVQVPQLSSPPQPSVTWPQFAPSSVHVFGVQLPVPHTFGTPPAPQASPGVSQVPHCSSPPQPSSAVPQLSPRSVQLFGLQPPPPPPPICAQNPNWHVIPPVQATQAPPLTPQACGKMPGWHSPFESQQPPQFAGVQGCSVGTGPQAANTPPRTTRTNESRRVRMPALPPSQRRCARKGTTRRSLGELTPDRPCRLLSRTPAFLPIGMNLQGDPSGGHTMAQAARTRMQPYLERRPGALPRLVNLVLGIWLFISAFAWTHTPASRTNAAVVGVLIVLVEVFAARQPIIRGFNLALAFWLAASTLLLAHATDVTIWNNLVVAAGILLFALMPSQRRRQTATT